MKLNKNKKNNFQKGFTVIELIVSMSLFVIISGIIVGSFITATRTQRSIISLIEARDNMGIAMEQMAREMRLGTNFSPDPNQQGMVFDNLNGDEITYRFDESAGVINRIVNSGAPVAITPPSLTIKGFRMIYQKYFPGQGAVPDRITISFGVVPKDVSLKDNFSFDVQTTVSVRQL